MSVLSRVSTLVSAVAVVLVASLAAPTAAAPLTLREATPTPAPPTEATATPPSPSDFRDVAPTVWFQGFLADAGTAEPVNATYDIVARIYTAVSGGALLWGPETHSNVPVVEGWFNIELGATVNPLPSFESPPYYLELIINGETLAPRSRLASVPSALVSSEAANTETIWTVSDDDIYYDSGNVSIGTSTTSVPTLTVENDSSHPTLQVNDLSDSGSAPTLVVYRAEPRSGPLLEMWMPDDSESYIHCYRTDPTGYDTPFLVSGDGHVYAIGSAHIEENPTGFYPYAIKATSNIVDSDTRIIDAEFLGTGSQHVTAVYGEARLSDGYGYGGYFEGGFVGAQGEINATGSAVYFAVYGDATTTASGGVCYGVRGYAHGIGSNYGVHGWANSGTTNWAGYFSGSVRVTGSFVNPMALLEIDDPTDPVNSYLRHPYVASSEMKTVYDGTVTLDAGGEATVGMPDWFEALNTEFRYQLTPVGAPGPNLYIAEKVADNTFRIAGGEPGTEVCWQVTGVRHDPSASTRALGVRVPKSAEDCGRYIDPAAYGAPDDLTVGPRDEERPE